MAEESNGSELTIFAVKNRAIRAVTIDLPPRVISRVPWLVNADDPLTDVAMKLIDEDVDGVLVIGQGGTAVGGFSSKKKIRIRCGQGDLLAKSCISTCEKNCEEHGGVDRCVIMSDTGLCLWQCKDGSGTLTPGGGVTAGEYLDALGDTGGDLF